MTSSSQSTRMRKRKVIFWIFICTFVPLAAALVAYAAGYRFDLATRSVIELSALSIDTIPDEATVRINGTVMESRTPYIQTLLPGEYTVRIEKEGYYTWEKQMVLEPKKSAIFPRVVLFAISDPLPVDHIPHDDAAAEWKTVPDELVRAYRTATGSTAENIQLIDGPEPILVDHEQGRSTIFHKQWESATATVVHGAITHAQWLNTQLIFCTSTELSLYNSIDNSITLLTRQSERILDVAWHPGGGYIFFSDAQGVHAIELDERDGRQTWLLSSMTSPTHIVTNARASILWFESAGTIQSLRLTRP